ncbi:MAG TPA: YdcF family protein [Candidatus Acidoferrales bacterium]|nr:YdcF family protein [Candidatus Acidoferrales bacterium]
MPRTVGLRTWLTAAVLLMFVLGILATLHWGGYLLISNDVLPSHADGAIILQASVISEEARIAGAVRLLQRGVVDHIILSIPKTGYWDLSFPSLARTYLEKHYGHDIASQFQFCETVNVDSTEQEAMAMMPCVQQRHWRSLIVVTSNFHSRRAGLIWRRTWKHVQPPVQMWVDGVDDPSFQPASWWRHRRYAKTWFFESSKLLWALIAR